LLCAVVVYGHQPSASTQDMVGASALCQEMRIRVPETKVVLIGGACFSASKSNSTGRGCGLCL